VGVAASFATDQAGRALLHHCLYISIYARPPHQIPAALFHLHDTQVALVRHSQYACPEVDGDERAEAPGHADTFPAGQLVLDPMKRRQLLRELRRPSLPDVSAEPGERGVLLRREPKVLQGNRGLKRGVEHEYEL